MGDKETVVCMQEGDNEPVCMSGSMLKHQVDTRPRIADIRVTNASYTDNLLTYLDLMEDCHHGMEEPWLNWQVNKGRSIVAYMPREPYHAVLRGDEMLLEYGPFSGRGPLFAGTMFDELSAAIELTPRISWLLDALEGCSPTIYGRAVRRMMTDRTDSEVTAWVKPGACAALVKRLKNQLGAAIDITYHPHPIDGGLGFCFDDTAYTLKETHYLSPHQRHFASTANRFCVRSDRLVHAARISWLDLAAQRARDISHAGLSDDELESLEMDGFRVMPPCEFTEPAKHLNQNTATEASECVCPHRQTT
jgi:hypothetical protein